MPKPPVFTERDIEELRRANIRLDRLPRVRMHTQIERSIAHAVVLGLEAVLLPHVRRAGVGVETRSVVSLGRRIRFRIIRPPGKLRGVHFDIHGGAWCAGNARMDDLPNVALAKACGVAVASLDYGRAPWTPLRTILAQCEAGAVWLAENARREFGAARMTIGGESAGAHLALCTLLKRRSLFCAALLYYGIYDLSGSEALRAAPRDVLIFHQPTMLPSLRQITPGWSDEERRGPDVSPAFADLAKLPPALMLCGTRDPLLAETETLRARWQAANGNADILIVPEAPHAFNRLPIAIARKTQDYVHAWLSDHFSAVSQ